MLRSTTYLIFPVLLLTAAALWDHRFGPRVLRALGPLYTVSESPARQAKTTIQPRGYEPCNAGCCDEEPTFCATLGLQSPLGSLQDACSYASVHTRCARSCDRCPSPASLATTEEPCEDEWPSCKRSVANNPGMCKIDLGFEKCRRSCGLCARPKCADSLTWAGTVCQWAKDDLRNCAKPDTAKKCPQTCGQCSSTPFADLLRRQPCVDEPQCARSDDDIAGETLDNYRACKDVNPISCKLTPKHPTKEALCADPMFRDTLCRGTCGGCTPLPPLPKNDFLAQARRTQGIPDDQCDAAKARSCPKKCGVCQAAGSRSNWDVKDIDRLVKL